MSPNDLTSCNAIYLLNSPALGIWKFWLLYVGMGVTVDSHMHIAKGAAYIIFHKVKKVTEMYCHCNN
jgi:hypothetical protein